jgi:peptidoglycan lytic transglycosylase
MGHWRMLQQALTARVRVVLVVLSCAVLCECSSPGSVIDPRYGVAASPRVVEPGQPVPKGGGAYRIGRPYMVAGRLYVPQENPSYRADGIASFYGNDFHGRLTANGEVYDMHGISAAHPTLPMPCYVRVTNLANYRSLIVRVNDRGPYVANREIDLSIKAAELLGFRGHGVARVRVEYVGRAPLEGADDRMLMATLREGTPAPAPSTVKLASAEPFLPGDVSERIPVLRGRAAAASGPVPIPAERPFDLGSPGAIADARVASPPQLFAQEAEPTVAGMTAYAPVRYDGTALVASGRGLY